MHCNYTSKYWEFYLILPLIFLRTLGCYTYHEKRLVVISDHSLKHISRGLCGNRVEEVFNYVTQHEVYFPPSVTLWYIFSDHQREKPYQAPHLRCSLLDFDIALLHENRWWLVLGVDLTKIRNSILLIYETYLNVSN